MRSESPTRTRLGWALTGALLGALTWLLALVGLYPLAVLLFPVPVAAAIGVGTPFGAASLALASFTAGWMVAGAWAAMIALLFVAVGLVVGVGFRRRWSWGITLTAGTLAGCSVLLLNVASRWADTRGAVTSFLDTWYRAVEQAVAEGAADPAREELVAWSVRNWESLLLGFLFGGVLLCTALGMSVAGWYVNRRTGAPPWRSALASVRPPDALVWLAIVLAGLWLYEQHYPAAGLRFVVWNAAVALAFVYWFNGLAVVLHGLAAFQTGAWVSAAVLLLTVYVGTGPLLAMLGFFDTWADWRRRLDKVAAELRARQDNDQAGNG